MAELTSAAVPPIGDRDHVRGSGREVIVYADLGCPVCAAAWAELAALDLRLCVRHFPIASKRPRSPALHAAAEAVATQSEPAFWAFVDSIYADAGHVDDPHLWARVRDLGLDLQRFEADRRTAAIEARVRADFEAGIRAGVTGTPALFTAEGPLPGETTAQLAALRSL